MVHAILDHASAWHVVRDERPKNVRLQMSETDKDSPRKTVEIVKRGDLNAFKEALSRLCDEYGFDITPELHIKVSGSLGISEAVISVKSRR